MTVRTDLQLENTSGDSPQVFIELTDIVVAIVMCSTLVNLV